MNNNNHNNNNNNNNNNNTWLLVESTGYELKSGDYDYCRDEDLKGNRYIDQTLHKTWMETNMDDFGLCVIV